jgi:hypothetical protein
VDIYGIDPEDFKQVTFTNITFVRNQGGGGVDDVYIKKPMDEQYAVEWVRGQENCIAPFKCDCENFDGGCPDVYFCTTAATAVSAGEYDDDALANNLNNQNQPTTTTTTPRPIFGLTDGCTFNGPVFGF